MLSIMIREEDKSDSIIGMVDRSSNNNIYMFSILEPTVESFIKERCIINDLVL